MVVGIDKFKEHFKDYNDNYVIIGGAACEVYEQQSGQKPRATKDIDLILIIEALSHDFVAEFWEFVKKAGYKEKQVGQKGEGKRHQYYRFNQPSDLNYPIQVELFSRSLDIMKLPKDIHITPIPTDADLSSLSAILMDEDYYDYTIKHSTIVDGVHISNIESLLPLKCKAFLEMRKRKDETGEGDEKHIKKHKNDVFRLVAALPLEVETIPLPDKLYNDVELFCEKIQGNLPDDNLIKDMDLRGITVLQLFERLKALFIKQE